MYEYEKNANKVFKKLTGQKIKKFSVRGKVDYYFHLITDKADLEFGANDLGVWIEKFKTLKIKGGVKK